MAKLKEAIYNVLIRITGGRPMKKIDFAFTDVVSGERVYYFEDKFGRIWLAEGKWSWFRVICDETREEHDEMNELFPNTWAD